MTGRHILLAWAALGVALFVSDSAAQPWEFGRAGDPPDCTVAELGVALQCPANPGQYVYVTDSDNCADPGGSGVACRYNANTMTWSAVDATFSGDADDIPFDSTIPGYWPGGSSPAHAEAALDALIDRQNVGWTPVRTTAELEACLESSQATTAGDHLTLCRMAVDHMQVSAPIDALLSSAAARLIVLLDLDGGVLEYTSAGNDETALTFDLSSRPEASSQHSTWYGVINGTSVDAGSGTSTTFSAPSSTANQKNTVVFYKDLMVLDFEQGIYRESITVGEGVFRKIHNVQVFGFTLSGFSIVDIDGENTSHTTEVHDSYFKGSKGSGSPWCFDINAQGDNKTQTILVSDTVARDCLAASLISATMHANGLHLSHTGRPNTFEPWFRLGNPANKAQGGSLTGTITASRVSAGSLQMFEVNGAPLVDVTVTRGISISEVGNCARGPWASNGILLASATGLDPEIGSITIRLPQTSPASGPGGGCKFSGRLLMPRVAGAVGNSDNSGISIYEGDRVHEFGADHFVSQSVVDHRVKCQNFTDLTTSDVDQYLMTASSRMRVNRYIARSELTSCTIRLEDGDGNQVGTGNLQCGSMDSEVISSNGLSQVSGSLAGGVVGEGTVRCTGTGIDIQAHRNLWLGEGVALDDEEDASGENVGCNGVSTCAATISNTPISPGTAVGTDGTLTLSDSGLGFFSGDADMGSPVVDESINCSGASCLSDTGGVTPLASAPARMDSIVFTAPSASGDLVATVNWDGSMEGDAGGFSCVSNANLPSSLGLCTDTNDGSFFVQWSGTPTGATTVSYTGSFDNEIGYGDGDIDVDLTSATTADVLFDYTFTVTNSFDHNTGDYTIPFESAAASDLTCEFGSGAGSSWTNIVGATGRRIDPFEIVQFDTQSASGTGRTQMCFSYTGEPANE